MTHVLYMIISNVICMYYKYNLLLRSYIYTNEKKKTYEGNNIFIFGTADLTGIARKKLGRSWSSLIKVEGLFSPYIVTHFDIVNS